MPDQLKPPSSPLPGMLRYALVCIVIAIIAGAMGEWGLQGLALWFARIFAIAFVVLFLFLFVMNRRRR